MTSPPAATLPEGLILVTGGAGFIGSALVHGLNTGGRTDIVVSDFLGQDEKWKNLVPLQFLDYLEADELRRRIESGSAGMERIRTIFHLGACSSTTERDAGYLIRNNFEYTRTLAHWALEHGARFVYASSAATYGDGAGGMDDHEDALPSLRPLNIYGFSKHLFDLYAWRKGFLPRIAGLKYFNVFGPNEYHKGEMRSVVHKAVEQIRSTGRLQLFKSHRPDYRNGEQKRDFLYVKDAVGMTLHFAGSGATGGIYNCGSGEAHTWLELAEAIFAAMELEPHIDFIDMPESIRETYQYYTQANISKLRSAGYSMSIKTLDEAVSEYVRDYLLPGRRLGEEPDGNSGQRSVIAAP